MSTPPPLSSASSSTNSPSPTTPHTELKADPSDTLEFLLQTMAQAQAHSHQSSDSSFDSSAEPDWASLSAWTQSQEQQKFDLTSDFNFSLPMDLDFDQNMAVDPSALHFTTIFDQSAFTMPQGEGSFLMSNEMAPNNQMLFPNGANPGGDESSWPSSHLEPRTGRRLSVTSSSSSSGASLSPVMEPVSAVSSSPPYEVNLSDPASELAQRVRQAAGVTLAVPVSAQVQQLAAAGGQAKLPIPRLKQASVPAPAPKRTTKSSPPPEVDLSAPSTSSSPSSEQAQSPSSSDTPAPPTQTVIGRPKTSHTTIERRYRTNLNARITGLKQSVPALRVLEVKAGEPNPYNDVVDSRGFVDGVKVARKMSKANILGKATEYIRVLKKREARLKREQDGLKSLISGLVGGPALLKEWEREWRDRFGGEEKDEIEYDDAGAGSDDDEGEGDDSDGDDDEGRARKKAKVAKPPKKEKPYRPPPPPPVPGVPGAVPEKRKRGRPRKVPLPPAPIAPAAPHPSAQATPATLSTVFSAEPSLQEQYMQAAPQPVVQSHQQPTQQYLLAVFAFFSVFNSPLTASHRPQPSHHQAHHGTVLTPFQPTETQVPVSTSSGYGLHDVVQAAHLLVSTLVFFYVLVPWLSGTLRQSGVLARLSSAFSRSRSKEVPVVSVADSRHKATTRAALMEALSLSTRGSQDEPAHLRAALGVTTGVLGLLQSVIKAARRDRGIELNQLEQRAWVRLGELIAFDGSVGPTTRLQTFWCMSWHISTFAASTTDLSTLALIIRPVSASKATELWDRARQREFLRAHEKIVLNNMTVEGAADWLAKWRKWHETERKGRCTACEKRTPLGILAAILIRERLRKHAASLFVRTVVRAEDASRRANAAYDSDDDESDEPLYKYNAEKDYQEELERKETIEAGKSIGGRTAELATLLERIWDTGFYTTDDALPAPAPRQRSGSESSTGRNPDVDADCEDDEDLASQDETEIRALLTATLIYRRIFPSTIPACASTSGSGTPAFVLSPPPSPSRRNARLHMALRTALGSPAFEYGADGRLEDPELGAALEDARDRVVDMLVDFEKACRRGERSFDD
ncbi:hypothetical protein GY45DRAFT_1376986 [Cubamyces sp. BRFM 1775]|nr:hypothetical protein GY45DRAFT_1376986 [Cubamyces sp. BRFM 1775]